MFLFQSKLTAFCLANATGAVHLAGVDWYDRKYGLVEPGCPTLAICYDNGRAQIMRDETDDSKLNICL